MATTTAPPSPQPPPPRKYSTHIPLLPATPSNSPSHSLLHAHCSYLLSPLTSLVSSSPSSFKLLDIGPGSGRLTTDLAAHLSLSSFQIPYKITALDSSPSILSSARAHSLSRGFDHTNIQYLSGSATNLPFPSGSFDAVHVHQVLSHISGEEERVRALREMVRVVRKPGGMIFIREGDLREVTVGPEEGGQGEVLGEFYRVLGDLQERDGAVVDGGRRLEGWIFEAGVQREKVRVGYGVSRYDTREERVGYAAFWPGRCTGGMFAEKAEEMGVAREKLEQFARAWKDWMNTDDAFLAIVHGEAVIRM